MVPEDLLFWISQINQAPTTDPSVLCRRHADGMVVPAGWTLDDRREATPRLFSMRELISEVVPPARPKRRRPQPVAAARPEQMQIDGTGEIGRPVEPVPESSGEADGGSRTGRSGAAWQPDFDVDDDLNGLLRVKSPLLARAFRGTDRPKH